VKWFTRKSQVLLAGKAPDISAPDYGMFVCSPPELRRLLLRESARHFHRAFELLGLFLFALRCDLKRQDIAGDSKRNGQTADYATMTGGLCCQKKAKEFLK
jgi:hypothetical protein